MDVFLLERGCYRWGGFMLDPIRRSLSCDGAVIKLAERLFDVLLHLVSNHGRIVDRDELLQAVWPGRVVEDNNVGQAIFELRKVLKAGGGTERSIVTVTGKGFRFAEPVTFHAVAPTAEEMPAPSAARWREHLPLGVAMLSLVVAGISVALWAAHAPAGHPAEAVFSPPAHSVAVLAFDNLSGDPAQSYMSDGLSEQLIDALTQVDTMRVAARMSAFSFRGGHATVGQVARALNVGAVLVGSVRRVGARVVVTAQLTDALTGFNVWSKTYDRDPQEIVTVQSDIALAVARVVQAALPGDELAKLDLGGTSNPAAYDAYLRGMKLRRGARGFADYQAALAEFDRAVALDPDFAMGHAKRAITLVAVWVLGTFGSTAEPQRLVEQAQAAADRAVALSPMLGAAHSARGAVLGHVKLDPVGAFSEQVKAKALTPGSAGIESNYASAALALGHVEQAVGAARQAAELDPIDPDYWGELALVLYEAHRYGEALDALDREHKVGGSLPHHHTVLRALVLVMMGRAAEARTLCAAGADWQDDQLLALADHALGRQAAAEADVAKMAVALGDGAAAHYAQVYAQWGRKAEALHWFGLAVQARDPGLLDAVVDPLLDPLRDDPGFNAGLARLSSAQAH